MSGIVKANEKKLLFWWVMLMLMILGIVTTITGCDSGWSVAGWEI